VRPDVDLGEPTAPVGSGAIPDWLVPDTVGSISAVAPQLQPNGLRPWVAAQYHEYRVPPLPFMTAGRRVGIMSEATDLHEKMFDAIRNRDLDGLRRLYHPDCVYQGPDGQELKGPDGPVSVAQMYLTAFPDMTIEIRGTNAAGENGSVLEFTAHGTHQGELQGIPPTGKKATVLVCNVIEVRDGKVYQEREYYDTMSMLQQLGVVPESTNNVVARHRGEGDAFYVLGGLYEVKAAGHETAGKATVMEMTVPVGMGPPPHTHAGPEMVYVLEGTLRYRIGDQTLEGAPGSLFYIPEGVTENFEPTSTTRLLITYLPGGLDKFFAEIGEPATVREIPPPPDTPPNAEALGAAGSRYGLRFADS